MSVLIKGLAMPDCCWNCPCLDGEYGKCNISGEKIKIADGRLTNCPFVELPDHGDLIDRDELIERAWRLQLNTREVIAEMLNTAAVVIPAERSEE